MFTKHKTELQAGQKPASVLALSSYRSKTLPYEDKPASSLCSRPPGCGVSALSAVCLEKHTLS